MWQRLSKRLGWLYNEVQRKNLPQNVMDEFENLFDALIGENNFDGLL